MQKNKREIQEVLSMFTKQPNIFALHELILFSLFAHF